MEAYTVFKDAIFQMRFHKLALGLYAISHMPKMIPQAELILSLEKVTEKLHCVIIPRANFAAGRARGCAGVRWAVHVAAQPQASCLSRRAADPPLSAVGLAPGPHGAPHRP